jgi:hypothetical protein
MSNARPRAPAGPGGYPDGAVLGSGRRLYRKPGTAPERWRAPDERLPTIWQVEWDETADGSEDEVRGAIAVLGGPQI